jgi:hypothetical protein
MITLQEAYLKAKSDAELEKRGLTHLLECRDYGDFWGFYFVHPTKEMGYGMCDITVNKKNGEIGYFNPLMDLDLWDKAIPIPIEQFAEYNVAI